jgi:hypothetical protein
MMITIVQKKNFAAKERIFMKRLTIYFLLTVALSGMFFASRAESMLSLSIGTTWPQALLYTGICSGDAELNVGAIVDKRIGFGFATDFLWNTIEKDVQIADTTPGKYKTVSAQRTFMFPVMGYFLIDPVPSLIVHPVAKFEIGYNSMIFANKDTTNASPVNYPYFFGLIIKGSVDALYNIGEHSSLFLGVQYQWADMRNAAKGELFDKRDMSGVGIRAGFRVLM